MLPMLSSEKRTTPRDRVVYPVMLLGDSRLIGGVAYDKSAKGAFVRPWLDKPEPRLQIGLRVQFLGPQVGTDIERFATVRWVGFSHDHQCEGFGVEFLDDEE